MSTMLNKSEFVAELTDPKFADKSYQFNWDTKEHILSLKDMTLKWHPQSDPTKIASVYMNKTNWLLIIETIDGRTFGINIDAFIINRLD